MAFVNILGVVYPVGAIYLSTTSTSPASIIGGTWQRVSGRYFRSGTAATQTGGSDTISWTYGIDWLSYYYSIAAFNQEEDYFGLWDDNTNSFVNGNRVSLNTKTSNVNGTLGTYSKTQNNSKHRGTTLTITKDLLPSYYTICMWVRTA